MIKISVIIPAYNVEAYIRQCIDSVIGQSLKEIEIIIIDDGSPDNCGVIIDDYAKNDDRIHPIHKANGGVSSARNAGLAVASGKYVYMIDADDWLHDGALEALWNEAEKTSADIVFGDYINELDTKTKYKKVFQKGFSTNDSSIIRQLHYLLNAGGSMHMVRYTNAVTGRIISYGGAPWRFFIRRSIIADNHLKFDTELRTMGEDILFMQYVFEFVKKVSYIPVLVYHYRVQDSSLSKGYRDNIVDVFQLALRKEEEYLTSNQKEKDFWAFYYFRVFDYIQRATKRFFLNPMNSKSEKSRFSDFKTMMKSEPYATAMLKLPLHIIRGKKNCLLLLYLRFHLFGLYWRFMKRKLCS